LETDKGLVDKRCVLSVNRTESLVNGT